MPTPSHAERARTLVSLISTGTLCSLAREPAGYPHGSLVTFAVDAAEPVFLISELAEHTKNLRADERASLLVAESHAEQIAEGEHAGSSRQIDGFVEIEMGQAFRLDFEDGDFDYSVYREIYSCSFKIKYGKGSG